MSSSALVHHADLRRLVAAGATLAGTVPLASLPRLRAAACDDDGEVVATLQLGIDDEGYRSIEGTVRARVRLLCQRCMEPMTFEIAAPVALALVWSEDELPSLPERLDGVVVGSDPTDLHALLEDEILLCLPLVARHAEGECEPPHAGEGEAPPAALRKGNPFAVLRGGRSRGEAGGEGQE